MRDDDTEVFLHFCFVQDRIVWTSGFGRIILCPTRCYLAFVRAEFIDGDSQVIPGSTALVGEMPDTAFISELFL